MKWNGKVNISFQFIWYDMWIGAYWNPHTKTLFICPLPMCVIRIVFFQDLSGFLKEES